MDAIISQPQVFHRLRYQGGCYNLTTLGVPPSTISGCSTVYDIRVDAIISQPWVFHRLRYQGGCYNLTTLGVPPSTISGWML
ncbi:hypothetical protein RRG08_062452 [Elysia crispata]|uniref:Uncharacterized protein n=1 Tax=Elysia crispata TaxID=231223 RepID=A0AAE0XNS0_9GAST|nr:hypothetical protein RRG08_062452 [Elysia crispata]